MSISTTEKKLIISNLLEKLRQVEEVLISIREGVSELQEENTSSDGQLNLSFGLNSPVDVKLPPFLIDIPQEVINKIDRAVAILYHVIPFRVRESGIVSVATDNPDGSNLRQLEKLLEFPVVHEEITRDQLQTAWRKYYPS